MTPPTVTIDGKKYPWPEGCRYFERRGDRFIFWRESKVRGFILNNPNGSKDELAAAVAVMHFENKARRILLESDAMSCGRGKTHTAVTPSELERAAARELAAAAAWRELCREV